MSINLCPVLRSLSRSNWKHNSGCELRIGSQRKKKQKAVMMIVQYLVPGRCEGAHHHALMHAAECCDLIRRCGLILAWRPFLRTLYPVRLSLKQLGKLVQILMSHKQTMTGFKVKNSKVANMVALVVIWTKINTKTPNPENSGKKGSCY